MNSDVTSSRRLAIDPDTWEVWLDGRRFRVSHPTAFSVFKKIADAHGRLVTREDFEEVLNGRTGAVRVDRVLLFLQVRLQHLVVGVPGPAGGHALRLPPRTMAHGPKSVVK